jgi:hypothetical protein
LIYWTIILKKWHFAPLQAAIYPLHLRSNQQNEAKIIPDNTTYRLIHGGLHQVSKGAEKP